MIKGDVMGMQLVDDWLNERCLVNIVCGRCLNKKVEINRKISTKTIHFSNLKLVFFITFTFDCYYEMEYKWTNSPVDK